MTTNLFSEPTTLYPDRAIKILIVDDLKVIREQIKSILRKERDFQIVGTANNGYKALEQLQTLEPDLVVLDLDMPELDGIETARIIAEKYPQIQIVILSSLERSPEINNLLPDSIAAYIIKDRVELELADRLRAIDRDRMPDNVIELDRSRFTGINTSFNDRTSRFTSIANTTLSRLQDWSGSAKELIDTMPLPWTRGLLYSLVGCIAIAIPWACLYRMDEIGTARGRLEFQGNTIKREADIEGSVGVLKVYVKKGDAVKAGQLIMELDAKNVREQISQNQLKIDGLQQRLQQLQLMKNQMGLGTNAQQQQNQAQQLEKESQIAQAKQNIASLESNARDRLAEKLTQLRQAQQTLADRQSSANLQKDEKIAQLRQVEQGALDAQTTYLLAQNRFKDAQNEANRFRKLYKTGAVSDVKTKEVASIALEKKQLLVQALASLQQAKLRVKEQQKNYQRLQQQMGTDIAQARLRLNEQQAIYRGTLSSTQADIERAKLELVEQQRGSQTLVKGGNVATIRIAQQLKEIDSQIVTIQSEIDRDRAQGKFLASQLEKYQIKAPTDGTIFELPIVREGAVVQPKQLIAEIAPKTNGLVFKGEIAASQSESLRASFDKNASNPDTKDVRLKFDEFPFESYDVVPGKLTWIAPNSKVAQTPTPIPTVNYEIEVQLDRACIKHEGTCIPFKSGQPATAEIVIRNRRIIDFVLDPFKKLGRS